MSNQPKKNSSEKKKYLNRDFKKNVEKLYLNTRSSDINFLFGSSVDGAADPRIAAHKILLAASSNVFDTMFYGDLKESGDIQINDASKSAFIEFLQFFYLNEVELTEKSIVEVSHLGQKYQVESCINACGEFLKDNLTPGNVLIGLELSILHDRTDLLKMCEKTIILNTAAVFKSDGFLKCSKAALDHILKLDIHSCSEVDVFEACMAWVKTKSGQEVLSKQLVDAHLGELYYKIRFALMTVPQFCTLTSKYESVLRDDFMKITNLIARPCLESQDFIATPRIAKWNEAAAIKCSFKNGNEWRYHLDNQQTTTFSSSEPLLLGGFTCGRVQFKGKAVCNLSADLSVEIEIVEAATLSKFFMHSHNKRLLKIKSKLKSEDTNIILPHPVLIRPGFFYEISIGPFPDGHIYYSEVLNAEIQLQPNIRVILYDCNKIVGAIDSTRDGKNIGLIWALNFNRI